eukprot:jgi/Botrbrau1/2749/Bobra.0164s0029.1
MGRLDHVVIAVKDLSHSAALLRARTGLSSVPGGRHPGRGTENVIVPLESSYVELITVWNPQEAQTDPLARCVLETLSNGRHLVTWVVEPKEGGMDALCKHAGVSPIPGSRTRPDGTSIHWRGAAVEEGVCHPPLPFFIEWADPAQRPGQMPAGHRENVLGISALKLGGLDTEARLQNWLGAEIAGLPVRWDPAGPPHVLEVEISTSSDPIIITDATFEE